MSKVRMVRWGAAALAVTLIVACFATDAQAGRRHRRGCCNYSYAGGCGSVCDAGWGCCGYVAAYHSGCGCCGYVTAYRGFDQGIQYQGSGCQPRSTTPSSGQTLHEGASPSPSNLPGATSAPPPPGAPPVPSAPSGNPPEAAPTPPAPNPPAPAADGATR